MRERPKIDVELFDCIGEAFEEVFDAVLDEKYTYFDLAGGRGSLKSSFVGYTMPLGIMLDPNANGIVFRKVANTIGDSVFQQLLWGIEKLGVSDLWDARTSPYKLIYRPTGQVILFKGLDKWRKAKSLKVKKGYFKYLWFEELDEFAGENEIRGVQQTVMRGGPKFVVFKTFNPPITRANWANEYVAVPRPDALRHFSNYLQAPAEWLGEQFLAEAELLKVRNPRAYEHEYMGIPTGTGGEVFENLEIRKITDEEIKDFEYIYQGLDFGWYPDPVNWSKMSYNSTTYTLYIYDELRARKLKNRALYERLCNEKGVKEDDLITADSEEPKSIADLRDYGLNVRKAEKGPESVRYSMKWLQSLNKIVIDPVRCPHAAREFSNYEYERTKDGEIMSSFPDADNHSIDSVRYGMNKVWKRKGQ